MKRIVSLLLALMMALLTLPAMAEGKTLTWARGYESTSLDPAESSDDAPSMTLGAYVSSDDDEPSWPIAKPGSTIITNANIITLRTRRINKLLIVPSCNGPV